MMKLVSNTLYVYNLHKSFSEVFDCVVHCPKRSVNFVTDSYGRWAPAINNENFRCSDN
jgi:hypothetical protein